MSEEITDSGHIRPAEQAGTVQGQSGRELETGADQRLFPMFLKLRGRRCLVVGGGSVAEGKVRALLESGAEVVLVAPEITSELARRAGSRELIWHAREFCSSDLEQVFLVISATDDPGLNARIYAQADQRGVLCNAVDDPGHCHFYFPAVVSRGPLQIAISTSGCSPALAQRLRRELEARFGEEYAPWVRELGRFRQELLEFKDLTPEWRRELLHQAASEAGFRGFLQRRRIQTGSACLGANPADAGCPAASPDFQEQRA